MPFLEAIQAISAGELAASAARAGGRIRNLGLSRAGRQSNLSGAFLVPEEAKARLAGLRVLLIDDVLTTGSTVDVAGRVLLRGGAKAVDVLVFARVVHDGFATT